MSPSGVKHSRGSIGRIGCHLKADSPLWECRSVLELFPASFDPDLAGVGGQPIPGDQSNVGVVVPAAPTPDQFHWYLTRQVAIEIPSGAGIRVLGLRQLYEIGTVIEVKEPTSCTYPIRRVIETPTWHFVDGFVSTHIRVTPNKFGTLMSQLPIPGTSAGYDNGLDTALLYNSFAPYVPPGNGYPPGQPVGDLGVIRSIISPWNVPDHCCIDTCVYGPGVLALYIAVKQTNPRTRCQPHLPTPSDGLVEEDKFVLNFSDARYTRVAGSLLIETLPVCSDQFMANHIDRKVVS